MKKNIFFSLLALISTANAQTPKSTNGRPPQFVLFAFDGSKSLPMWNETRQFAKQMTANGKPLKFTYFINSTYYLTTDNRKAYVAPHMGANGAGKSAIGFGGSVTDIRNRYDQTNMAFKDGNEIANHAAGHFDGSKWTLDQWKYEFQQFFSMMFDRFLINNHTTYTANFAQGWVFGKSDLVGFRAPQLGFNKAMYSILPGYNIKYDTSQSAEPSYWPEKNAQGIWNFPLGQIRIAGTNKKTLSMDYNFYYYHTNARENPSKSSVYEEQMYQSYVQYFQNNYANNRAPVNIGHHFSLWNGGAYWRAMKRLAQSVCGLPEVKCVTYKEYMNYLNSLNVQTLASYRRGLFAHGRPVQVATSLEGERMLLMHLASSSGEDHRNLMIADPPQAHDESQREGMDAEILRSRAPSSGPGGSPAPSLEI